VHVTSGQLVNCRNIAISLIMPQSGDFECNGLITTVEVHVLAARKSITLK
jgi:hypothetical protein